MFLLKPPAVRAAYPDAATNDSKPQHHANAATGDPTDATAIAKDSSIWAASDTPAVSENGVRVKPPLNGRDWKYVAEGGANVLFRHHPSDSADPSSTTDDGATSNDAVAMNFKGKLLRVKKCDMDDTPPAATTSTKKKKKASAIAEDDKPYVPNYPHPRDVLQYATHEIMPFLVSQVDRSTPQRSCFMQVAELIEVDQSFLSALNEQVLSLESRPKHRRHSQIDVSLQCVMVLPDVTLPPPDDTSLLFSTDDLDVVVVDGAAAGDSAVTTADSDESQVASAANLMMLQLSSSSSSSDDSDENDEQHDHVAKESAHHRVLLPVAPRLRRLLSSYHRNIFDCCFRNICVEIKPKIGFKPQNPLLAAVKHNVCRFCMHQHYKRAAGKVAELSEYCPLDLFSRDPARIRHALRALQRTPQNNFKVFVRSTDDDVVNVITGLNADALPKGAKQPRPSTYCRRKRMGFRRSCHSIGAEDDATLQHDNGETDAADRFDDARDQLIPDVVELITDVLMRIPILDDLKQMQLLDHISVDGVWHIQQLLASLESLGSSTDATPLGELVASLRAARDADGEDHMDDDVDHTGSIARSLAFLQLALCELNDCDAVRGVKTWDALPLSAAKALFDTLLQRFQVATTLKDCSLLLCLRRSVDDDATSDRASGSDGHVTVVPTTQGTQHACRNDSNKSKKRFDHLREYEHAVAFRDMTFNCVVAVVDLDVKSHKSVGDYFRLDEKIVANFVRQFGAVDHALCTE